MGGIFLAAAFLVGIILHDSRAGFVVAAPLMAGGVIAIVFVGRHSDRVFILLALVILALGAWRAQTGSATSGLIAVTLAGDDRSVDAMVVGLPRRGATRTTASVSLRGERQQKIDLSLPLYPSVNSGDVIRFWAPESWGTTNTGQLNLPFSAGSDALFIPSFRIERSSNSPIDRFRTRFNAFLTGSIERHVPEPAGALTLGILNGDDTGMTDATRADFRAAGMSHITAVSGWNVALVAGLIAIFTARFSRNSPVALLAGVGGVWAYAFVVGMGPSVLRAAGMATVFLVARWRGRPGDLLTSLLIVVALIVALTPMIRFDIGFQLSVVATLGIVLFFEQSSQWSSWQSALALPFVAEIAVAPLILHHFGMYSLLSPLANVAAAPLVELVMAGGVTTAIGSLVHPTLADIAGMVTWVPARLIIAVAERTGSMGAISDTTVTLSWTGTFVTYLSLLFTYVIWSQRKVIRRRSSVSKQVEEAI